MGFIEAVILLFLLGWISSYLYRKYLRKRNKDWLVFLTVIIIPSFWIVELLVYFNIISILWLNNIPWINIPINSQSGSYFMWNSFILFGIDFQINPVPNMFSVALIIFISYILWFYAGLKIGRIIHGYYTHEEGLLWILGNSKIEDENEK